MALGPIRLAQGSLCTTDLDVFHIWAVAIFNGAQTPFVIRRDGRHFKMTGETAYELVGESYFHKVMDGEAVDDEKEEMIQLI
jgi:hypothetical protein